MTPINDTMDTAIHETLYWCDDQFHSNIMPNHSIEEYYTTHKYFFFMPEYFGGKKRRLVCCSDRYYDYITHTHYLTIQAWANDNGTSLANVRYGSLELATDENPKYGFITLDTYLDIINYTLNTHEESVWDYIPNKPKPVDELIHTIENKMKELLQELAALRNT